METIVYRKTLINVNKYIINIYQSSFQCLEHELIDKQIVIMCIKYWFFYNFVGTYSEWKITAENGCPLPYIIVIILLETLIPSKVPFTPWKYFVFFTSQNKIIFLKRSYFYNLLLLIFLKFYLLNEEHSFLISYSEAEHFSFDILLF